MSFFIGESLLAGLSRERCTKLRSSGTGLIHRKGLARGLVVTYGLPNRTISGWEHEGGTDER